MVSVLDDLCAHRGARLSAGTVDGECLRCPYHSWAYADDGRCTHIPQLAADRVIPRDARVESFRTSEHGGLIWTCLVDPFDRLAIAYRRRLREIGFELPGVAVRSDAATG